MAAVVGLLLLMGKLVFKDLLKWAMVLANTYGELLVQKRGWERCFTRVRI